MKKFLLFAMLLFGTLGASAQLDKLRVEITDGIDNAAVKARIEGNAARLLESFNGAVVKGKKPVLDERMFTPGSRAAVLEMWKTSAIACPVTTVQEKCLTTNSGYQLRNIPVTLLDAPEGKQDQELVVNFDKQGRIDNILIAMDSQRYVDILGANTSLDDFVRRQVVLDFVENFRTAYNRKDIDYIETVFSDDAIIITGKVVKVMSQNAEGRPALVSEKIVYRQQDKPQYISNLKRTFKRNKYIDVVFDDIEVLRHPVKQNIYGVTLKQLWGSSTYNDTGYVFLMIDFTDEMRPVIQVRTWQPDKYNNRPLNRDEIFSLDSFNL